MCPEVPEFLFGVVHDFNGALRFKRKQQKVHRKVHNIETTWTCNGVACIFRNWTKPINWRSAYALKMKIPYEKQRRATCRHDWCLLPFPSYAKRENCFYLICCSTNATNNARFLIYSEMNHWSQYLNWNLIGFIGLIA